MNKMALKETITDLILKSMMPEQLVSDTSTQTYRLVRSGVTHEVTENIVRLTDNFYEYNSEAKKDHDTLAEVCKMLEEAKYGGSVTREDIYEFLRGQGYIE
jgi:hypothetical protein